MKLVDEGLAVRHLWSTIIFKTSNQHEAEKHLALVEMEKLRLGMLRIKLKGRLPGCLYERSPVSITDGL